MRQGRSPLPSMWALILSSLLLAACQPALARNISPATVPPAAATSAVAETLTLPPIPAATEAKTVLRVGTGDVGQGLTPHMQIIQEFELANPDIQIDLEPVSSGDYYDDLLNQFRAGRAPDIMQIGDDAVPQFVQSGVLTDLGPFMRGHYPVNSGIYLPGVFQPGEYQGKQYLLPKDFSTLAVYYNKEVFDAYRAPYPKDGWTWDDFRKTAQGLTLDTDDDGKTDVWGVQLPAAWTTGFEYWAAAAGGQLISEDGQHFDGYMDAPNTVSAAQFYADLYQKYAVAPPPADIQSFGGGNHEFADGQAAMMISGHWPEAELKRNTKIDLGVVGMPVGTRRANVLFWSGFGIASTSSNKEAAWRFLRFYTGSDAARIWAGWGLPTVKLTVAQLGLSNDPIEGVWLGELAYLTPRAYLFTPYWGTTADPALQSALKLLIVDHEAKAGEVLQKATRQAQAELERQRRGG